MVELLVKSKIKEQIKTAGFNTGGDALEAIEKEVKRVLARAFERASQNSRKTVMGRDI